LAGSAATYASDFRFGWRSSEIDFKAKIIDQADRAISLAPNATSAFLSKASYFNNSRHWNEVLKVTDAGLAANPNLAALHALRGVAENSLGRFEQAKTDLELAMRLSPAIPGLASGT
jgi:tetratricopeptide (TPR) repeat protein